MADDNIRRLPTRDADKDPIGFARDRLDALEREGVQVANLFILTLDTNGSLELSSSTQDRERQLSLLSVALQSVTRLFGEGLAEGVQWVELEDGDDDDS